MSSTNHKSYAKYEDTYNIVIKIIYLFIDALKCLKLIRVNYNYYIRVVCFNRPILNSQQPIITPQKL